VSLNPLPTCPAYRSVAVLVIASTSVVAKRRGSALPAGARTRTGEVRVIRRQEFVVCGTEVGTGGPVRADRRH